MPEQSVKPPAAGPLINWFAVGRMMENLLPPLVEFRLIRLPQRETLQTYGRWGDGEEHFYDGENAPTLLPEWHCNMTLEKVCETCGKLDAQFWPRGHGHTPAEAIGRAYRQYLEYIEKTEAALPPQADKQKEKV